MHRAAALCALALWALIAGCLEDAELSVERGEPAAIIGGIPDTGHENVVLLRTATGLCTGTLVAPRIILTAAHCVEGASGGNVDFTTGLDDPDSQTIRVSQIVWHRYYDPSTIGAGLPYDIAMMRLRDPAPDGIEPMEMNLDPLPDLVGDQMLAVGFGNTDGAAGTGSGIKRRAFLPINSIGPLLIGMGNDDVNTCQGDSGGPGIYEFDAVEHVIGITSTGPAGCVGNSHQTRLDIYRDEFVLPILAAWDGPCQHDGTCVEDGCAVPDPDCDSCQLDGFCASGCPSLDLDCPVTGFAGDLCNNNDGCESRHCVEAHDDSRVKYCSAPCDASLPIEGQCDPPLSVCGSFNGEEDSCHYAGITPSTQGSPCQSGGDCRSSVCDPDHSICIEQCGDGLPECSEEFSCEPFGGGVNACTFPPDGCGCVVGARNRSDSGALVLLGLVGIFAVRRRARPRHS